MVYVAEASAENAIRNMKKIGGICTDEFIKAKALQVIDSDCYYQPYKKELNAQELLDSFIEIVSNVDFTKFKGVLGIGSCNSLLHARHKDFGKLEMLIEYEQKIGREFDKPIEIICCYGIDSIRQLELKDIIAIYNSHAFAIQKECNSIDCNSSMLFSAIYTALNNTLGSSAGELILKTIQITMGITADIIISKPELFEQALVATLGKPASKMLVDSVKNQLIEQLVSQNNT